jgi:hypothetical protein
MTSATRNGRLCKYHDPKLAPITIAGNKARYRAYLERLRQATAIAATAE